MTRLGLCAAALVTVVSTLSLGGCLNFYDQETRDDYSTRLNGYNTLGQAELLRGDMGNIRGFSSNVVELRTRVPSGGTSATVQLDAVNTRDQWWVMTQLSITGGFNHPGLQPGAHLVFESGSSVRSTTTGTTALRVSVLGCSGPRRPNYTYDRTARRVEVDIEQGATWDTRRMRFTATFDGPSSQTQTVTGSFEYEPR